MKRAKRKALWDALGKDLEALVQLRAGTRRSRSPGLRPSPQTQELCHSIRFVLRAARAGHGGDSEAEHRACFRELAAILQTVGREVGILHCVNRASELPGSAPVADSLEGLLNRDLANAIRKLELLATQPPERSTDCARTRAQISASFYLITPAELRRLNASQASAEAEGVT